LIVQDSTLLHQADVFQGLGADGCVLISSRRSTASSWGSPRSRHAATNA
jgi:hypothetical protein